MWIENNSLSAQNKWKERDPQKEFCSWRILQLKNFAVERTVDLIFILQVGSIRDAFFVRFLAVCVVCCVLASLASETRSFHFYMKVAEEMKMVFVTFL